MANETALGKKVLGIGLAAAFLIAGACVPAVGAISPQGVMAFGVLFAMVSLWVSGAVPTGVAALFAVAALALFGVTPLGGAFSGFASPAVFFVIAIFAMPAVMLKTGWGVRLISRILKITGPDSAKMVLGFMIATAVTSTIMSDLPTVVLYMGFAMTILNAAGAQPGTSNLGKCLMIGIPFAAVVGGIVTPAGSSFNVIAMNLLAANTDQSISFLQWVIVGLPVAVVLTPICWICIVKLIPPEPISDDCLDGVRQEAEEAGGVSRFDIKAIAVILTMVVLWIAGNWVSALNATIVALVGLVVMFLPGMSLLTWKEFKETVPWDIVLLIGGVLSVGNAIVDTGGAQFVADFIADSSIMSLGFMGALLVMFVVVYLIHTFATMGQALLSVFLPIMFILCDGFGVSAAVPTIGLAVIVAGNFLMPVNPTLLVAYGEGYYKISDLMKVGAIPAVALILCITFWVPFIVGVLGI